MIYYVGTVKFSCYFTIVDLYKLLSNLPREGFNSFWFWVKTKWAHMIFDKGHKNYTVTKEEYWKLVDDNQAVTTIEKSNIIIFEFSVLLCIMFNICLCLDSYLVFKNPFYPVRKRMTMYTYLSIGVALIVLPLQRSMMYTTKIFFKDFLLPFSKSISTGTLDIYPTEED